MAVITETPTRRRLSLGFKIFLSVVLALLVLAGLVFGIGAARQHASVDQYGRSELFYTLKDVVKNKDVPLKQLLISNVNTDTKGYYQTLTRFPKVTDKFFVMQLVTSDGYTWTYDGYTGFTSSGCSNLACFVGIHTQGPFTADLSGVSNS